MEGTSYLGSVDQRVTLLLHYRNVIRRAWPAASSEPGSHIDHIIPEELFGQLGDEKLAKLQNHICNLAPLPTKVNRDKSSKVLNDPPDRRS